MCLSTQKIESDSRKADKLFRRPTNSCHDTRTQKTILAALGKFVPLTPWPVKQHRASFILLPRRQASSMIHPPVGVCFILFLACGRRLKREIFGLARMGKAC